ncbi:MAG: hypothetical protein IJZ90_00775 [Clostridia bacterium]|nr:hypothetical protein [Clostridia bacterium]
MKKRIFTLFFMAVFVAVSLLTQITPAVSADEEVSFSGNGTQKSPYLIQNADDLRHFRDLVNEGNSFEGKYFRQTENIDLNSEEWVPIGIFDGDTFFYGIYDGDGHYIENLYIGASGNNGLFGKLGGIVMNLGIESGEVHGACIGAFTSHAAGSKSVIINCYNKADVYGSRGGGIADNYNGTILNCWTDCELYAEKNGDIYSYDCIRAENCYTNNGDINEVNADTLNKGLIDSAVKAELEIGDLNTWTLEGEQVVFSGEKYSFVFSDLPQLISAYLTWIMLALLALFAFVLILHEVLRKQNNAVKTENAE